MESYLILIFLTNLWAIFSLSAIEQIEDVRRKKETEILFKMYPKDIPYFPVRLDSNKEPVSRGRWELLDKKKKTTLKEFREKLQCDVNEPALDEYYGTISLMLLFPPTKESVELMCAWAETRCGDWAQCRNIASSYKAGGYPKDFGLFNYDMFQSFRMLRIHKGELYSDWPWGINRIPKLNSFSAIHYPLVMLLERVSDIGDSVFWFGGERPVLPWKFPFPQINEAGSMIDTNTILWPWESEFAREVDFHNSIVNKFKGDFSDHHFKEITGTVSWKEKTSKAAFFASPDMRRVVLFEQAARHPDLFLLHQGYVEPLECWDPQCTTFGWNYAEIEKMSDEYLYNSTLSGLPRVVNVRSKTPERYVPGKFKYVVVPDGMGSASTSSRLLNVLGHCACVVLLVNSNLQFHFSGKLLPWVHYVPLANSGADLAAKVRYLIENDHVAEKIAINGKNFATSYLRFEDYVCYAAAVFDSLAIVMSNTTALEPFNPISLKGLPLYKSGKGYGGYRKKK